MGRKLIYYCDSCSNILSDGEIGKPHISIRLDYNSGWARKNKNGTWAHSSVKSGIYQFCSPKCLATYFKNLKK